MDEATHKKKFKPINIKDLFMDKNPAVARWIPRWAQLVRDHTYLIPEDPLKKFSYIYNENSR